MIACAVIGAFIVSLQVITAIHLENPFVTVALGLSYLIVFQLAINYENKLLRRITKLEEKLERCERKEHNDDGERAER